MSSESATTGEVKVKTEGASSLAERILTLCREFPEVSKYHADTPNVNAVFRE